MSENKAWNGRATSLKKKGWEMVEKFGLEGEERLSIIVRSL